MNDDILKKNKKNIRNTIEILSKLKGWKETKKKYSSILKNI